MTIAYCASGMNEKKPSDKEMDLALFPRPSPFWNVISLCSPVIVGFPVFEMQTHPLHDSGWGWGAIGAILLALGLSSLVGLISGVIALVRRERLVGLTILALFVNGLPFIPDFPNELPS